MNKLNLNIKYRYYDDRLGEKEELHPMSFMNSFNPNTVLKAIEDILHYVFVRGKRKDKYWSSYNGKYMGKQYFTTISIIRNKSDVINGVGGDRVTDRWILEVFIYDDYRNWKDGYCEYAKHHFGFYLWSLNQLLDKVFEICGSWDDDVLGESLVKCLKPHLIRHNLKNFDELYEKCRKCDNDILRWEREYRKVKFERDKEVNKIFESVSKEWIEE
jgi:translation initiation factor 2 beta subunit (eIF-2beta)/eIF-5|tara:strand:+ start:1330 stop:1974 length:645 start_codon:yes stop_codon:yes gene_type:complete